MSSTFRLGLRELPAVDETRPDLNVKTDGCDRLNLQ